MTILETIQTEIQQPYYRQNFANDGQRFVAWYMRNIHLLDQCQTKDAVTDGANDKQIDAVYIDEDEQKIYVVQGKYYTGDSIMPNPCGKSFPRGHSSTTYPSCRKMPTRN